MVCCGLCADSAGGPTHLATRLPTRSATRPEGSASVQLARHRSGRTPEAAVGGSAPWLALLTVDRPRIEASNPLVACSDGGAINGAVAANSKRSQPPVTPGRCRCAASMKHAMTGGAVHADSIPARAPRERLIPHANPESLPFAHLRARCVHQHIGGCWRD